MVFATSLTLLATSSELIFSSWPLRLRFLADYIRCHINKDMFKKLDGEIQLICVKNVNLLTQMLTC